MSQIRDKERTIVFDPAQEIHRIWKKEKFMTALELSDILFCNKFESMSALKYASVRSFSDIVEKMIVCTEGAEGSEFYNNGKRMKIPVINAKRTADNTGAGDAYRAGFYAGKYNKYSDVDSLIIGAATASFAVEEVGALSNIPSLDDVMVRADKYLGKF
jgi:ribokinase